MEKKSKTCPCRCQSFEIKENKLLKRLLSKIVLKCPLKCDETISYDNYFQHINKECSTLKEKEDSASELENLILGIALLKMHLLSRKEKQYFQMPKDIENNQIKSCLIKIDKHEHPLTAMIRDRSGWSCDICEETGNGMTYYCSLCDYDCCPKCQKENKINDLIETILRMSQRNINKKS